MGSYKKNKSFNHYFIIVINKSSVSGEFDYNLIVIKRKKKKRIFYVNVKSFITQETPLVLSKKEEEEETPLVFLIFYFYIKINVNEKYCKKNFVT